jgi:type I restriction-modification system DNA methylase subunit
LGVPKPTEMTIRNFLLKELENRGVKVNTELSFTTPIGRLMPDMLLYNGAQYVVETKLGAEAKLLDAMVRLYDYSKYTPTEGAFAVLLPKEFRQPWNIEILEKIAGDPKLEYVVTATFKDLRPSQRFAGNLSQMADWMAGQVLRPLVVEADTSFAIKVLTEAVTSITASVKRLRGKELEDIFGGKTVFENILQYDEGRYPLEEMRQAATYLLVNQIIFYHVLSKMDLAFEAIDEDRIGKPSDLLRYFRPVLERDYSSVFGFDVASRLPESATKIVKEVIMTIKALAPEKIGQDVLGKVFHELIPFNIRKAVAAFYTNNETAEILAQLAIDKPDAKVIDLAVGSGTLLVAAYRRKRELLRIDRGGISLEDHKRFLEHDLTGIDIMPFTAHLAVMHLSLQALLHETEKVRIAVWDSTELTPDMTIPTIYSELKAAYRRSTLDMFKEGAITPKEAYINKGAIALEGVGGEEIPLEKADLVIMNPPFTRAERLPKTYKAQLKSRLKEYEDLVYGRVGLHNFFIFLADRFAKKNGKIALVLPATVLRILSMKGVRKLWVNNYHIKYIITTEERAAFSEASQFRRILLVAEKLKNHMQKGEIPNDLECKVVVLKRLPKSLSEASKITRTIQTTRLAVDGIYDDRYMNLVTIRQGELKIRVNNLFTLISLYDPKVRRLWERIIKEAEAKLVKCDNYFVENSIEAYEDVYIPPFNSTFIIQKSRALKKHDVWVIKKEKTKSIISEHRFLFKTIKVPYSAMERGFRRPSGCGILDISNILDYIVVSKFNNAEQIFPTKSHAEKALRDINRWKRIVNLKKANLLVSRRFDLSARGTKLLAFYSNTLIFGVDMWSVKGFNDNDAKVFALWFNSALNLLQIIIHRTETRGAWMKLNEYQIRDSMILNPKKLTKKERHDLLSLFKKMKSTEFPSIINQLKNKFPLRVQIDKTLLKVLGFDDDEIDSILNLLYHALAKEIEKLKTLMER